MPKAKASTRGRVCEVPLCGETIAAGKLMCRDHWYEVPKQVRQRINHAWKRIKGRGTARYRQEALRDYRAAVTEAVSAVEAKRP